MKIHFLGAARTVTGSKHLIETAKSKILLECGLFQGRRQESFEKNNNIPIDTAELDAIILSHAHIDHSGALPVLIKKGYKGKIYSTPATKDITAVMLQDSAYIQEMDAEYFSRKLSKTALRPIEPLYTQEDALKTAQLFEGVPLHQKFKVTEDIHCTFFDAGHVLGSATVLLEITEAGKIRKLLFTGDLGRKNRSILRDPEPVKAADILICESTYGARFHPEAADNRQKLAKVVKDTASKGGKLIIPSFSLERTQEVVFDLSILKKKNQIPKIDVVIDSPLSTKVTELFKKHVECFDQEAQREFLDHGHNPFDDVIFTRSVEESKALNHRRGPFIIISASGMCEAGRIRHHLRNNITHSKNTILIVGFQAEHTLGRRLVERRPYVKIFDEMHQVNADIEVINGFSGHADQRDLLNFIDQIKGLNKVFLIHGESTQSATLGKKIRQQHPEVLVDIPEEGEVIEA